jgi:hypothetical protein
MKAYTMITNKTLLERANVGGTGINSRDKFVLKEFGGKIFTEELFLIKAEDYIKNSPGFGTRGGLPGSEKRTAKQLFSWWKNKGAIFSIG